MQTNHQETDQTYGGQSFAPVEWNPREQEPEAAAGDYTLELRSAKYKDRRPQGGYQQLGLVYKIVATSSESDECQKSIGGTIFDTIRFMPMGEKATARNANARQYVAVLEAFDIDMESMPTSINSEEDAQDLVDALTALKGQQIEASVRLTPRDGGGFFVNVNYARREASAEVEEERPAAKARTAARPAAKPAAKTNGKKPAARR